jgi:uncharacterized membrane protein (UPF0127 family)
MSMRTATVYVSCSSKPLCHRAWLAQRAWQRLRGMLFRPPLQFGEGLLLLGVSSVHTFGMRGFLDVIFLTADFTITGVRAELQPRRLLLGPLNTGHTLELPAGTIDTFGVALGDQLRVMLDE